MRRRLLLGLLLLIPTNALAQTKPPEALLAADSILFFRFDGFDGHRQAYDQTVMAELMRGDLGKLFDYVGTVLRDTVGPTVLKERFLEGIPPDQLLKIQSAANQIPHALHYLTNQGFLLGVELIDLEAPRVQLTVVFPNGGDDKNREAIFSLLRIGTALAGGSIKETKQAGRTLFEVEVPEDVPVHLAWWQEGPHAVLTFGTEKPDHILALAAGKRPALTENPLFRHVGSFKKYESLARGFLDFERGLKLAQARGKEAQRIVEVLGLESLKNLTVQFGFEGKYDRSTIVLNLKPGERKGLLRLAGAPDNFDLSQLPPLPPDIVSFSALHLDLATFYDVLFQGVSGVADAVAPKEALQVKLVLGSIDVALGLSVRKDFLGALEPLMVIYTSPSEGPLSLGTTLAIKVKDPKKLQEALDKLFKSIPAAVGADISQKKRSYHGVDMYTVHFVQEGFPFVPSYTIHKGWWVVGLFPQTVQGYVLRSTGKYATYQPTDLTREVLANAKKSPNTKVSSLSVSDPRPTIQQLMSIAPLVGGLVNSFFPGSFDVAMLPNAQVLTEPLFPNVTISVDEGDSIRLESYASLSLPLDLTGVDVYAVALFFSFAIARIF